VEGMDHLNGSPIHEAAYAISTYSTSILIVFEKSHFLARRIMTITVEGRTVVRIVTHNRQYGAERSRGITMRQRRDEREMTEGTKG